jgi:hypothetical protein
MSQEVSDVHATVIHANDMPPTPKVVVSIRIAPSQHTAWTAAAAADDRSLANWLQRCCDHAAAAAGFDPKSETPPQRKPRAKRKGR